MTQNGNTRIESSDPDPAHMARFCAEILPSILVEACHVSPAKAEIIGRDVFARAEAFAALNAADQEILASPFVEEVATYHPLEASVSLKAFVNVVVRNSLLEEAHAAGPVNDGGLEVVTTAAVAPLSHLLAARRRQPLSPPDDLFVHLPERYPRAWAALRSLVDALGSGGRHDYRSPDAPVPPLPAVDQVVASRPSQEFDNAVVESAIDPLFNQHLLDGLTLVIAEKVPFYLPSLSRISRNVDKLLYVIELLLAHDVPILTTNYLLRSDDVWVRKGALVPPDSRDPRRGLTILDGLSGAHRKMVREVGISLAE
ncbi:hypothetical protein [Amycolatopsis sp. H20-H5]|uniref:hypothetical protein n=1 Tax=Amycolatopsis sp. H20-H5 TaxID=3046309 RepID=UPI002DBF461A|nr:hypothetical protein [Amycolatopsis sp. H20-H5]MEC3979525.1 hypothetical protein [Amycolatopsis sp. H20-H5]